MRGEGYRKPPIVEAVIDIQFADETPIEQLRQLAKKMSDNYPFASEEIEAAISIGIQPGISVLQRPARMKLSATDVSDQLLLGLRNFTGSRLAPYLGWQQFQERTLRDWHVAKSALKWRKVARVATRYINRIDIPNVNIKTEEYIRLLIVIPPELTTQAGSFSCQPPTYR